MEEVERAKLHVHTGVTLYYYYYFNFIIQGVAMKQLRGISMKKTLTLMLASKKFISRFSSFVYCD